MSGLDSVKVPKLKNLILLKFQPQNASSSLTTPNRYIDIKQIMLKKKCKLFLIQEAPAKVCQKYDAKA